MLQSHKPSIGSACLAFVATLGLVVLSAAVAQNSAGPAMNPDHPESYVVQRGDTLWDISAMFLREPWYWPEIWQINPQVANPHLIYPGDVLSLAYLDDGRPVITLQRGNVERLSPRVRVEPLEEAIPTIPYELLRAFLSRPTVLAESQLEGLPYIVANRDVLIAAAGDDVYVRNTDAMVGQSFNVVHAGEPLVDPDDGDVLGYEGIFVGEGAVRRSGDPATMQITSSTREAMIGDYLIADIENPPVNYFPRPPAEAVDGSIIAVVNGLQLIGQYQVVVINRGARHGLEPGHVLTALTPGKVVDDPTRGTRFKPEKVQLPDEPAGTIMVFSIFDRMSYALVMEATSEIAVYDRVRDP